MTSDYALNDTPMTPGSCWPDGSRVSNWRQAVAALTMRANRSAEVDSRAGRHAEIRGDAAAPEHVFSHA